MLNRNSGLTAVEIALDGFGEQRRNLQGIGTGAQIDSDVLVRVGNRQVEESNESNEGQQLFHFTISKVKICCDSR